MCKAGRLVSQVLQGAGETNNVRQAIGKVKMPVGSANYRIRVCN